MLLYLAMENQVVFSASGKSSGGLSKVAKLVPNLTSCQNNSLENEYCALLRNRIADSDGGGAKDLSVLMIPVDYTNRSQDGSNSKLEIMGMLLKVRGSYLEQLRQQVINCTKKETEKKEFQVKIQLDNLHYSKSPAGPGIHLCGASTNELGCSGLNIQTNFISPKEGSDGVYEETTVRMRWAKEMWNTWNLPNLVTRANVSIVVKVTGLDSLENLALPSSLGINERILKEEIGTDLTIVAENGVKIKCHKIFLMIRSPVFKAMFKNDMKEATTNTLELKGMTEESVRAFLAYLYHSDTTEARKSCEVALQLFEAGHKYDVEGLENAMEGIIVDHEDKDWFTVDMVIRLFIFARNFEAFRADFLKTKAVNVLNLKSMSLEEIKESSSCQEMFRECPEAAMDLLACVFARLSKFKGVTR